MLSIHQRLHPLWLVPVLVAGMLLGSCNDNPTTIGADYVPRNVEFHSYTLRPSDFTIESSISDASNSSGEGGVVVAVGRAPDGTVAHGLLGITTQSPLLSGSTSKPVKSATLTLHAIHYRYGDTSTRQVSFDVVALDQSFSSNQKWSEDLAAKIESAPSLGTFAGSYNDSGTAVVTLDAAATQKFLQEYYRYDTITVNGVRTPQFTVAKTLALRAAGSDQIVCSYLGVLGIADSNQPKLNVTVDDSTVALSIGVTSWIAKSDADTGVGKIIVMAGTSIRTLIKLNLDSIPDNAAIHSAELKLFIDPAKTRHGTLGETNYLVGYLATDTSFAPGSFLESNITGVFPVYRLAADSVSFTNMFRFTTLSPTLSGWLRSRRGVGTLNNKGIILAVNRGSTGLNLETSTVDRVGFFSTDAADSTVRPKLTIIYSIQVDAK
jgi:hypothetical protein